MGKYRTGGSSGTSETIGKATTPLNGLLDSHRNYMDGHLKTMPRCSEKGPPARENSYNENSLG